MVNANYAYLVAIMDWHSRSVLSWEVSNTMDNSFCVDALKSAWTAKDAGWTMSLLSGSGGALNTRNCGSGATMASPIYDL